MGCPGTREELKNECLKLCALRALRLAKANRANSANNSRSRRNTVIEGKQ